MFYVLITYEIVWVIYVVWYTKFDKYVIRKTNQSAATLFPAVLDVNNPKFFELLDIASKIYNNLTTITSLDSNKLLLPIKKIWLIISLITILMRLFFF